MKNIASNPGDRRHLVQIQQRSSSQDATGSPVDTWSTIRTSWASIRTANSPGPKENYQDGGFSANVSHVVNLRSVPGCNVLPGMRVVCSSHTYTVQWVDNPELRGIELNLMCLEIDGGQ